MAKKTDDTAEASLLLTQSEQAVVRNILADWINEELVVRPYSPEVQLVLKKFGIETAIGTRRKSGRTREAGARRQPAAAGQAGVSAGPEAVEPPLRPNLG